MKVKQTELDQPERPERHLPTEAESTLWFCLPSTEVALSPPPLFLTLAVT